MPTRSRDVVYTANLADSPITLKEIDEAKAKSLHEKNAAKNHPTKE